jgi:thiosulfate/3-mercaptopyruvate sulfurtransferase
MRADPMVSTEWLEAQLDNPKVLVIDATWYMPGQPGDPRAEHAQRHIPGAVYLDIDEVADHASALPHMLPEPHDFATHARRLGADPDTTVVVYDAQGLFSAARVWWMFRVMGHDDVRVLDGGLPKWIAEARPLESGWPQRAHGEFKAHFDAALVRDLKEVAAALAAGEQVLDARSAGRFTGEEPDPRDGVRPGHMPGAHNLHWARLVTPQGRLADRATLAAAFAEAGVDVEKPILTTCGSGVSAAILALGLARLGAWRTPVYDGSWSEWGAAADAPAALGPAGG